MKKLILMALVALGGCASTSSGPISAGTDTFVISRQAGAAFPTGREPLLAEALGEAQVKCTSLSKTVKLLSTTENTGPFIFGNYPKATIIFTCI